MTTATEWMELLVGLLALIGATFVLLGSIGLVRFSDYLLRLHAASKTPTLGVGSMLVASALYFSWTDHFFSLLEPLAIILLFATVPVSALMLIRAVLHLDGGLAPETPPRADETGNSLESQQPTGSPQSHYED